jgi:hypothetical protein
VRLDVGEAAVDVAVERFGFERTPCQNFASSGVSYRPIGLAWPIQATIQ